jgi:ribonuclease P protein component
MGERLTKAERITRRSEFKQVYERGTRVGGRFLTLLILPNHLDVTRLGTVATRKLGGAVQRNRAKRLIREIFRRNKTTTGLDLVVLTRREMLEASFADLESDYRAALRRYRRRA